jgi:hypothetical protein
MIALVWHVGTSTKGWLRACMSSNFILNRLRPRHGLGPSAAAMVLALSLLCFGAGIVPLVSDGLGGPGLLPRAMFARRQMAP